MKSDKAPWPLSYYQERFLRNMESDTVFSRMAKEGPPSKQMNDLEWEYYNKLQRIHDLLGGEFCDHDDC